MSESSQNPSSHAPKTQNKPPLLLCEALGFSPQLLLDDIINIANKSIQDGVNGMEEFLQKWADERIANGPSTVDPDATMYEVEQGLVAFQTLLEHHTDIAFDFFEAWCLRNIFMIPPDLPVILPHQEGLDLTATPEKEQELVDEIDELRKRLDGQRKLNRLLTRSVQTASRQLSQAERRLDAVASLSPSSSTTLDTLAVLPSKVLNMYNVISSLPPLDITPSAEGMLTAPGKRQWETNKTGYANWAVGRLLVKSEGGEASSIPDPAHGSNAVDKLEADAMAISEAEEIRQALEAVGDVRKELSNVKGGARSVGKDDNRMEE